MSQNSTPGGDPDGGTGGPIPVGRPDPVAAGRPGPIPGPVEEPFWQSSVTATMRVDPNVRPDLKRGIPAAVLAIVALIVGVKMNGPSPDGPQSFDVFGWRFTLATGWITLIDVICLVVFVVAGGFAARSTWRELQRVAERRGGPAAGQAVRLICTIAAVIAILVGVFAILQLDLRSLLLGSAVTGVIIGIAAQQTLNNFFAGLVLFFARPYVAGQRVKIRAGSMGGPFTGVIVGAGMMYTVIETDDEGLISMPNAGLMAAAIGPDPASMSPRPGRQDPDPAGVQDPDPAAGAGAGRSDAAGTGAGRSDADPAGS